jgi:hypothetical protein
MVYKISRHSLQYASSSKRAESEDITDTNILQYNFHWQVKALKKCNDYVKKMKEAKEIK